MKKIIIDRSTINPDEYAFCYWGAILRAGKLWDFTQKSYGAFNFIEGKYGLTKTNEMNKAAFRQDETTAKEVAASIGYELEFVGDYTYDPLP